jgi:hypothetical protein
LTLYGAKSEPAHTERRPQKKRRLSGGLDNGFLRHFKFGGYKPGTFQGEIRVRLGMIADLMSLGVNGPRDVGERGCVIADLKKRCRYPVRP